MQEWSVSIPIPILAYTVLSTVSFCMHLCRRWKQSPVQLFIFPNFATKTFTFIAYIEKKIPFYHIGLLPFVHHLVANALELRLFCKKPLICDICCHYYLRKLDLAFDGNQWFSIKQMDHDILQYWNIWVMPHKANQQAKLYEDGQHQVFQVKYLQPLHICAQTPAGCIDLIRFQDTFSYLSSCWGTLLYWIPVVSYYLFLDVVEIVIHSYCWLYVPRSDISTPFYENGLTLIPAWICNHIHYKVWDESTYPFLNFNGATIEV